MCRLAIERFAKAKGDWELVLCDIRPELLSNLVEKLPQGLATIITFRFVGDKQKVLHKLWLMVLI